MPTPVTDGGDLVSRLRRDLSAIDIDCACRMTLDSALDRFSAHEQRRRLHMGLEDARRHMDWIAAQLAFLAELDEITEHERDGTVFEEMALLFDEIVAAAGAAALSIREAAAPPGLDTAGSPSRRVALRGRSAHRWSRQTDGGPDTIDDATVEAKFDKGVLKVTAAKKPEAMKAERKIEIKKS